MVDNRYGEIITDVNKIDWYYVVKWYRPPHKCQEDTDGFQAGDAVYNATNLNKNEQAHHWYTPIAINTFVRVHYVLAANFELQKSSSSIKFPNTCNRQETSQKGAMKLPDCLQKGLLDEIIRRCALDFIDNGQDGHKQEEE